VSIYIAHSQKISNALRWWLCPNDITSSSCSTDPPNQRGRDKLFLIPTNIWLSAQFESSTNTKTQPPPDANTQNAYSLHGSWTSLIIINSLDTHPAYAIVQVLHGQTARVARSLKNMRW